MARTTQPPHNLLFREALQTPAAQYSQALLTLAYNELGVEVKFTSIPFARSLLESNKGVLSGEVARVFAVSRQYTNLLPVPYILFDTDVYLLVNQNRCPDCHFSQLKTLSYVRGSVIIEQYLQQHSNKINVVAARDLSSTEQLFSEGKVDAVLFAAYIPENINDLAFPVHRKLLLSLPDYHLLHYSKQELIQPLAAKLFELERNGVAKALRAQFNVPPPRQQLDSEYSQPIEHYPDNAPLIRSTNANHKN